MGTSVKGVTASGIKGPTASVAPPPATPDKVLAWGLPYAPMQRVGRIKKQFQGADVTGLSRMSFGSGAIGVTLDGLTTSGMPSDQEIEWTATVSPALPLNMQLHDRGCFLEPTAFIGDVEDFDNALGRIVVLQISEMPNANYVITVSAKYRSQTLPARTYTLLIEN